MTEASAGVNNASATTKAVGMPVGSVRGQARGSARRRLGKTAQQRLKVALVVLSVAAFGSALAGVVALNPGVKTQGPAAGPVPASFALPAEPAPPQISSAPLVLPAAPQSSFFQPRARTRGS